MTGSGRTGPICITEMTVMALKKRTAAGGTRTVWTGQSTGSLAKRIKSLKMTLTGITTISKPKMKTTSITPGASNMSILT